MTNRRSFLAAIAALFAFPAFAQTTSGVLTAKQANKALAQGTLILIDIRTPQEWQDTGVAKGAWPLDMTQASFASSIMATLERNPDHDVAVICRTGRRSAYVVGALAKNGITNVLDVSEGMAGGKNGAGWIKSGLGVVSASEALSALPQDFRATN